MAKFLKVLKWSLFTFAFVGTIAGGMSVYYVYNNWILTAPKVTKAKLDSANTNRMLDRKGNTIWESQVEQRQKVTYDQIPHTFVNAIISTENKNFFSDKGISISGTGKAILTKLGGKNTRGGSTITQQLIKLSVFSTDVKDQTIKRKVQEMWLAFNLNNAFSKKQIFEFYINKMYVGHGRYGVQTISQYYFDKPLNQLTPSQQIIIAGLGQSPDVYNLYTNQGRQAIEKRRNEILNAMVDNDKLSNTEAKKIRDISVFDGVLSLKKQSERQTKLEKTIFYNQAYIQSTINELNNLGYNLKENNGLVIHTGLDPKYQKVISNELNSNSILDKQPKIQMASTAVDPKTGLVLAQVGGRNLTEKDRMGINRATQRERSSGSGIKPLVDYLPAIESFNWGSKHILSDRPYTYSGTNIKVGNADGKFMGNITMSKALAYSRNTTAIRTLDKVGSKRAIQTLDKLGIPHPKYVGGQDAIGLNASTSDMAGAFSVFANGGIYHGTHYVNRVDLPNGKTATNPTIENSQAISQAHAYIMTDMLKGVLAKNATGEKAYVKGVHQAVKTGTVAYSPADKMPNGAVKDSWVNGYTKGVSISTWMGYDEPLKLGNYIDSKNAVIDQSVYADIMKQLMNDYDHSDWKRPHSVINGSDGLTELYDNDHDGIITKTQHKDVQSFIDNVQQNKSAKLKHANQTLPTKE